MHNIQQFWQKIYNSKKINPDINDFKTLKNAGLLINEDSWNSKSTQFISDLPAEPFVGDLDAKIYILTLNPGAGENEYNNWKNPILQQSATDCVNQKQTIYPFYYLDQKLSGTGGAKYWLETKFSGLIRAMMEQTKKTEADVIKKIAQNVCDLELCAYRSASWNNKTHNAIASKLDAVKEMKKFIQDVVIPGIINEDKTFLVGRGRNLLKDLQYTYNGKTRNFDDLETDFPDRVVFYRGQKSRKMSFTPFGYTKNGKGGTPGGELLLQTLKKLP